MHEELWMVEAIIQPFKLEPVTLALAEIPGLEGLTITECRGSAYGLHLGGAAETAAAAAAGTGGAAPEDRHGNVDLGEFSPKVKLEIAVVDRSLADHVADSIAAAAHTGRRGDGRIFIWPISKTVKVRTFQPREDPR